MRIRKGKLNDIDQVTKYGINMLKLHAELDPYFTPVEDADIMYRKFLKSCLSSEDRLLLVAEDKNRVVGYAAAEIQARSPIFKVSKNGYINDVFVEEEYRKLGIATKFLSELNEWFKSRSIEHIELSVISKNAVGKKAWARFGFDSFEIKERVEIKNINIEQC
ncbi:MAG TPA: GNAT family N-acetyltransferase [Perlabentimonas sp.]|jgi:GNAT superfamily N-acetyltransferase|nr:GNAT family N-acetyltransferase [Bacteroidales bacterium]MDD4673609.1 GNAT family N-acetyltransferase [Bacteroidales bacterium]HZJ74608.1 GNAT family N-acetyltransferase [Perlabentimonas sp.]